MNKNLAQKIIIILALSNFAFPNLLGMEEAVVVVEQAAREGGVAVEELSAQGLEAATRDVAERMGISVEDIAQLPEETKGAFVEQLSLAFKEMKPSIVEGKISFKPEFNTALNSAKTQFATDISKMNLSSFKQDFFATKFNIPKGSFKPFTPKLKVEVGVAEKLPPEQEVLKGDVEKAQARVSEAKENLNYAFQINDTEKMAAATKDLNAANAEIKAGNKKIVDLDNKILQEDIAKEKAAINPKEKINTEETVKDSEQKVAVDDRRSADMEYKLAKDNYYGSTEARAKVNAAEKKITDANAELKTAKPDSPEAKTAQSKLEEAQKEAAAAREELGTQAKLKKAINERDAAQSELKKAQTTEEKAAAQKKFDEAEARYKQVQELDRVAERNLKESYQNWLEKGSQKARWGWKAWEKTKTTLFEQIVNGVVGGFAFSIPNFVLGPIETAFTNKEELENLEKPHKFANMWMQIPRQLINTDLPTSSKFLYVKLSAAPDQNVTKHDDNADKDLNIANYFMARDNYDNYATAAITDANFPGFMVHLNTGYYFNNAGTATDVDMRAIPALTTDAQKYVKEPLRTRLDEQAGQIRTGQSKEVYTEFREVTAGYPGSPEIADLLDSQANSDYKNNFPDAPSDQYGKILDAAVSQGSKIFTDNARNRYTIVQFTPLDLTPEQMKEAPGLAQIEKKPYLALGNYVYQTQDTPRIKAIQDKNPALANIVQDYVLFLGDNNNIIPLTEPIIGASNYPTYEVNPNIRQMLSLTTGDQIKSFANKNKEPLKPVSADSLPTLINKASNDENITKQIIAMKALIDDQLKDEKYGSFTIGTAKLKAVSIKGDSKVIIDKGVYVYERTDQKIEGGQTDYLVGTIAAAQVQLPNSDISSFVSLVTSRIYDGDMNPYKREFNYYVYQRTDNTFYLSTSSNPRDTSDKQVANGKWPLYALFMDREINPLKPSPALTKIMIDAALLAGKSKKEAAEEAVEMPIPPQWALSPVGIWATPDKQEKLGTFIDKNAPEVRKLIDASYTAWRKSFKTVKFTQADLGPHTWAPNAMPPVLISATSIDDITNGIFIYQSKEYPKEYLALADNAGSTVGSLQNFARQFNEDTPQRYLVSLTKGLIYDRELNGDPVPGVVISDFDGLLKAARVSKNKALVSQITQSQQAYRAQMGNEEFGPATWFGPFKLFISQEDLDKGQFIYADVTGLIDKYPQPLSDENRKKLMSEVKNYFVTIQTDNLTLEEAVKQNTLKWGLKVSENTKYIVSFVTGAIYDRNGIFAAYMEKVVPSATRGIEMGFQNDLKNYVTATWKSSAFQSSATWQRIVKLAQESWQSFEKERAELQQLIDQDTALNAPLLGGAANAIQNLISASYIALLQNLPVPRYIKKFDNKYYAVSQDNKVIVDFNAGTPQTSDTKLGKIYDNSDPLNPGKVQLIVKDLVLDNMRAYNGVIVGANGAQTIDVAIDHPAIPVTPKRLVKLDSAALQKKLAATQGAYNAQQLAFKKIAASKKLVPGSKEYEDLRKKMITAAVDWGYAKQEYQATQAVTNVSNKLGDIAVSFYYNEPSDNYLVRLQHENQDVYYDLISGYGFNADGTPALAISPVYKNSDPSALPNDYFFLGRDIQGLFSAIYTLSPVSIYYRQWIQIDLPRKMAVTNDPVYPVSSEPEKTYNDIQYNQSKDSYSVYETGGTAPIPTATYVRTKLYSTFLTYFMTRKGTAEGEFVVDDNPMVPPILIWDGKQGFNFQSLMYQVDVVDGINGRIPVVQLLPLKSTGANQFTATIQMPDQTTKTITIVKNTKDYGTKAKAHWISIIDGGKTYEFLYSSQALDPSFVGDCPRAELTSNDIMLQRTKLGYLKQCEWQVNVVVDSTGVTRLVSILPSSKFTINAKQFETTIPNMANRSNIVDIMTKKIENIQDTGDGRFVYRLDPARDGTWPYYDQRFANWMVDLGTGILYDTSLSDNGYPRGALRPSQLATLLDRLNVAVITDPQGKPQLIFRSSPQETKA